MLELTKEQHQAIQRNGDRPARVRDPETETTYVLLREDMYEQLKSRLHGDDFDPDEVTFLETASRKLFGWGSRGGARLAGKLP